MAIAKHKTRRREVREGRALARRVHRGDSKAFELLYASYEGGLYRFCHRLTGSDAAAAALVEGTFVRVLTGLPDGRIESLDIGTRLHATARLLAYERHTNGGPLWLDPVGGEHAGEVGAANQRLAPRQRMALALRDLERLPDDEIALALGAEAGAVPELVARARLRLREELRLPEAGAGCRDRLAALSAYVDGTLPACERADLETHVADCAGCRAALFALQEAALRYRALPVPVPPGELNSRITVALGVLGLPPRAPRLSAPDPPIGAEGRQTRAAITMAALVLVGAGVTFAATRMGDDRPGTAPVHSAAAPPEPERRPADAPLRPASASAVAAPAASAGGRVVRRAPPVLHHRRAGPIRKHAAAPSSSRRRLPPRGAGAPITSSLRPFSPAPQSVQPPAPPKKKKPPTVPGKAKPKPTRKIPVQIAPPIAPPPTPATADVPPPAPEPPPPPETTTA